VTFDAVTPDDAGRARTGGASDGPRGEHLLLYDGVCALCNGTVRFVLERERDPRGIFDFAALQGRTGQALLRRFGRSVSDLDTVYVVAGYRSPAPVMLDRSTAAIFVLMQLRRPWRWLAAAHVLPTAVRDWLYNLVARNRYGWFGRFDTCMLPPPDVARRFLD
jgi:predicted DCC family thiol-disulfide oxidoreductase YuxK